MIETKRFPLATILGTRDSTLSKDGLLVNCYHEQGPSGDMVVKRPGLSLAFNLGLGCAQGAISFKGEALAFVNNVINTLKAMGKSWLTDVAPPKPTAGFGGNSESQTSAFSGYLVSMNGILYSIGAKDGADARFGVYSTTDASAWGAIVDPAFPTPWPDLEFIGTNSGGATVLQGSIFFLSYDPAGPVNCWRSSDGANWVKTASGISSDSISALITYNNTLLAFFGSAGPPMTGATIRQSTDFGATWVDVNTTSFTLGVPNFGFALYQLNNNLYIAGGSTLTSGFTDASNVVWRSQDGGVSWVKIQANAPWDARKLPAYWVAEGRMWLATGTDAFYITYPKDLWSSVDGINWTQSPVPPWSGRVASSSVVHNGNLFLGPGFTPTASPTMYQTPNFTTTAITNSGCAPFDLTLIPANGTDPIKVFFKTATKAWVFDGSTVIQVLDPDYPPLTVPGVVYLDGSIYVMDAKGRISGSDLNDPTSWSALDVLTANAEADAGVALARQLNYVVAFKQFSIQFFYDAGNATGSPLLVVANATLEIGLAAAGSLAFSDNTMYFMSNARQKGRSIMKMEGYTPTTISTPFIDRILNTDDLATVYAFVVKSNGHFFYVITLVTSNITLAFDETTKEWAVWTTYTNPNGQQSAASAVIQSDGSILITMPLPHGASDGDPVLMGGFDQAAANGLYNITYVSQLSFSYFPVAALSTLTGASVATIYIEGSFPGVYYSYGNGVDYLVDVTSGQVYIFDPLTYQDAGLPINTKMRTQLLDFETLVSKRIDQLEMVGDNVSTNYLVRYNDNDYGAVDWSPYELVSMSYDRALLTNQGSTRRRAYEVRHTDDTALRLKALEFWVKLGAF